MIKICSKCEESKPLSSEFFYHRKKAKDGFRARCKICVQEDNKKYYGNSEKSFAQPFKRGEKIFLLCKTCKEEKPLTSEFFRPTLRRKIGFLRRCKRCISDYTKLYRQENPLSEEKREKERHRDRKRDKLPHRKTNKQRSVFKYRLKYTYGITLEEYEELKIKQNNECAICEGEGRGRYKVLDIDHDHETGKVRGLLCHTCNSGIGMLKDSTLLLEKAINYLNKV